MNEYIVGLLGLIGGGGVTKIVLAYIEKKSPSLALAAADIKAIERLSARLETVEKKMHLLEFACIKAGIDIEKLYEDNGV
jgi:hypothetical protein